MVDLEYRLSKKGVCLNWENWEDFVDNEKSVFNGKTNNICILFICCNSFNLFNKCLEYLKTESNQQFDILVVDNSTDDKNIQLFHDIGIENKRISILKPVDNIGGAGGFPIGIKYIMSKNYEKLIIFEDDIVPVDKNMISEMINISDEESVVKNSYINIPECECGVFHLVLYPKHVIKSVGVPDPRYFLKGDDTDFEIRLKKGKFKTKYTGKFLFHPNLKYDGWKNRVFGLYVRNELCLLQNNFSISLMLKYIFEQLLYIRYGTSKLFIEKNLGVLKIYFSGLGDFMGGRIGYKYSLKLLNKYRGINIPKLNLTTKESTISEFSKLSADKYYLYLKFVHYKGILGNIPFSNKFSDSKNGIIAGGILCPLYPVFMLFKRVIFLEEFVYESDSVKYEYFENKNYFFTIIKLILSFLISIFMWIPIVIILSLKFFMDLINKNGKKSSLIKRYN